MNITILGTGNMAKGLASVFAAGGYDVTLGSRDADRAKETAKALGARVRGDGLLRKGTKSRAGDRTLPLPVTAVALLRRRFMAGARLDQPLFPDVLGGFRDPANVRRDLREARGTETLAWITSHSFRKTAATILDEAALSARLVADQLGHSRPSMTQDVYMGRRAVDSQAAIALEVALRGLASPDESNGKTMASGEGETL